MKIALIDNYDSFTYNLLHLVRELGEDVCVFKNDGFDLGELNEFDGILLSPGPGLPSDSGQLLNVIKTYAKTKPILGICLGEQAIAEVFGGRLTNLEHVYHGIQSEITINNTDPIFVGLPKEIKVGRYHSWVVSNQNLPECLRVIAESKEGQIMAIRHTIYPTVGIQFHPESILTPAGKVIISNWFDNFNVWTSVKRNLK